MDVDEVTLPTKITECEVCLKNEPKYTCPKCEVRTCSLDCNKIHKKELECDGVRDKVKFKTIKNFNNIDLLNDYRLLEETARLVSKARKLPAKSCYNPRSGTLPTDLYRLKCAAQSRGVFYYILPPSFTRHISNTTFLDHENQQLYWRIDWIFPQAENIMITDERVKDSSILSACLHKYIDPEGTIYPSLSYYQAAGHSGIKILLKAERTTQNRFFMLDPSLTVRENLEGKPIIEFPEMYVILSHHIHMYQIFSEEEEHKLRRKKIRTRNPRKNHKNDSQNNYFFSNQNDEECNATNEEMLEAEDEKMDNTNLDFEMQDDQQQHFSHHGRGRGRGGGRRGRFGSRWRGNNRRGMYRGRNFRGRQGDGIDNAINGGLTRNFDAVNIKS